MDQVKEAFAKVKQDISFLQDELFLLNKEIVQIKSLMNSLIDLSKKALEEREITLKAQERNQQEIPTHNQKNTTYTGGIPTDPTVFNPLKPQKQGISTGNDGVPTDRQTNQQTNQQTDFSRNPVIFRESREVLEGKNSFKEAAGMLESLDAIKKELRLKFKKLTDQEIVVFSALYQLEEERGYSDYKVLSEKLNLTESSIRDYVGKLIKKGIPVDKVKINNKSVQLKISPDLKKVASLPTILLLRDI